MNIKRGEKVKVIKHSIFLLGLIAISFALGFVLCLHMCNDFKDGKGHQGLEFRVAGVSGWEPRVQGVFARAREHLHASDQKHIREVVSAPWVVSQCDVRDYRKGYISLQSVVKNSKTEKMYCLNMGYDVDDDITEKINVAPVHDSKTAEDVVKTFRSRLRSSQDDELKGILNVLSDSGAENPKLNLMYWRLFAERPANEFVVTKRRVNRFSLIGYEISYTEKIPDKEGANGVRMVYTIMVDTWGDVKKLFTYHA